MTLWCLFIVCCGFSLCYAFLCFLFIAFMYLTEDVCIAIVVYYLSDWLSVFPSVCLSIWLSVCLRVCRCVSCGAMCCTPRTASGACGASLNWPTPPPARPCRYGAVSFLLRVCCCFAFFVCYVCSFAFCLLFVFLLFVCLFCVFWLENKQNKTCEARQQAAEAKAAVKTSGFKLVKSS